MLGGTGRRNNVLYCLTAPHSFINGFWLIASAQQNQKHTWVANIPNNWNFEWDRWIGYVTTIAEAGKIPGRVSKFLLLGGCPICRPSGENPESTSPGAETRFSDRSMRFLDPPWSTKFPIGASDLVTPRDSLPICAGLPFLDMPTILT